jgi:hypothetical protein
MLRRPIWERISAHWQRRVQAKEERWARAIEDQRKAEREWQERREHPERQQIVAALHRIDDHTHSYTEKRIAYAESSHRWERRRFWLDVAAIIVAAFGAYYLLKQQHTMQGQLDEMRAEQRAWMKVVVIEPFIRTDHMVADGLHFWEDGAHALLGLHIVIKNMGNQPAFNVRVMIGTLLGYAQPQQNMGAEQATACEALDKTYLPTPAMLDNTNFFPVIFPGDDKTDDNEALAFRRSDVEKFSQSGNGKDFQVWFYGCIRYTLPNGKDHRQTGFAYRAWHEVPSRFPPPAIAQDDSFIWGVGVPADKIHFEERPMLAGSTN